MALSEAKPSCPTYPSPNLLTVRVGPAPVLPLGVAWARSLHLSVPQFPTPLSPLGPGKVGGLTRGQCLFQREFSDLGIPHASRGGETFFIQHCRGQALVSHLLRSAPRRGPEGVLCFLGSWGWPLHGGQVGLGSLSGSGLPALERQKPQGLLMFICCTETCVGALVKNVNGTAPCLRMGSGSLKPVCVVGGDLIRAILGLTKRPSPYTSTVLGRKFILMLPSG